MVLYRSRLREVAHHHLPGGSPGTRRTDRLHAAKVARARGASLSLRPSGDQRAHCHSASRTGAPKGLRSLAHQHRGRLTLEINVRLAAHVNRDALDRTARKAVGPLAGVVLRHRIPDIAANGQPFARDHVPTWLGLDTPLTDLLLAVVQGK